LARFGILGGTFNPPHVGHLVCALDALDQLELDAVVLMPVHTPPHKEAELDPGGEARLRMCELAVAGEEHLRASRLELDRAGPSWTVDTLRAIHATSPGDELTFIVGGDQAHGLPTWREPEAVLSLATLAVAERAGVRRDHVRARLDGLAGADRVVFFDMPRIDISSSEIRRRVGERRPIRHLVPDAVATYITEERLYLQPAAATLDRGGRTA
jgi:nicotinate-nucleotide adenylyltransferase